MTKLNAVWQMQFSFTTPLVKMRLERSAELVGAKPLHLLTQTALPLKSPTGASIATLRSAPQTRSLQTQNKIRIPLNMPKAQRRRPPPVAETGRSCWDSGQQDASAAQGTMRMLGAATRQRRAFIAIFKNSACQNGIFAICSLRMLLGH